MVMSTKKERNGFDTLVNVIHQQNGWRASIMWWFCRLKFCFRDWKYADKRHKWKEKVQKNAQFPFCGQTTLSCQPCFLHGGSGRLACFEPTKAARFLETLEVQSVHYDKKSTFLRGNFCIYTGFMDVFYLLTAAWKKNHKMCILKLIFCHVLDKFNLRKRNELTCLTRITF